MQQVATVSQSDHRAPALEDQGSLQVEVTSRARARARTDTFSAASKHARTSPLAWSPKQDAWSLKQEAQPPWVLWDEMLVSVRIGAWPLTMRSRRDTALLVTNVTGWPQTLCFLLCAQVG